MKDKRLVIACPYPQKLETIFKAREMHRLRDIANLIHLGDSRDSCKDLDRFLPEAFALIGQMDLPRERLEKAPNLKVIFNVEGNFYQNIDYDYCFANNIYVLNCGVAYAQAVAEMGLCFALDLARNVSFYDRKFREGTEIYLADSCKESVLLSRSEVGIIGFGNLGRALLALLQPFHCIIKVFDPWVPDSVILENNCIPVSLEEVLSSSKFIFVLAGVTKENEGFLSAEKLKSVRKNAFFILLSRSAVVDFSALTEILENGSFSAAIDVFPEEPMPSKHVIRSLSNVILSPHRAGGIPQAFEMIGEMVVDDFSLLIRGLAPVRLQKAEYETVKRLVSKPAG